ncbi:LPXTG cell wall anchor domain-containing protein [Streptococcus chenjunshii]|uniref:LPXTG cell wall anchor domain-containing protein n=1 Tax=Streptococcus chenjunshii TaxID=2173853 RepID=A0A372KQA4_9STRE|nr:LPXTG cell wall anchor domain-containing protein [Streptococcus chenjunshii]AXQ78573.1 LPXTG cell wall anchor domain-containing protein [Streptococcus chenjunshii]RFU51964.1 LPXTG cell wall anchor domain-containing protein [Streptococcus chenjunshii]RFU54156.1 LPXTG cell wall anchor domain-containing protein [Streptococcus chenjunshii]
MTKKQLITALATSTLVLSTTVGTAFADEVAPIDPATPSTEIITPEPSTQPDPSSGSSTGSDTGTSTEITVPVDPTIPSTGEESGTNPNTPGTSEEEPSVPSTDPAENPTTPSQPEESPTEPTDPSGTVEVPTTDGETSTVTPDTSVPTNNPNISAETAANAGASQVGTTSSVTGQIVQDVTSSSPVYTNTGATIISTQDSQVVLSDGTITSPEAIGAITNSDGTISVITAEGVSTTLPKTGEVSTLGLSFFGGVLTALGGLFLKKRKTI